MFGPMVTKKSDICVLGVSHKTAAVDLRERLAFAADELDAAHRSAAQALGCGVVIISTCNRTEIVAETETTELLAWLADNRNLPIGEIEPVTYCHEGNAALKHIFSVASGLDSLVVGEPQILGQLKDAVRISRNNDCCSSILGRAFDGAFSSAKRVRSVTDIGVGGVSVAYVAVTLASQIFSSLDSATALLVGAGDTIKLVAQHLRNRGVNRFIVINRTLAHGHALASSISNDQYVAEARPFEELAASFAEADVIITSTAARTPFIHKADIKRALKARRQRPMLLIDLAVPRDIGADVQRLDAAYVYTVDDLQRVIQQNTESREVAVTAAKQIIAEGIDDFIHWQQSLTGVELIKRLRQHGDTATEEALRKAHKAIAAGEPLEQVMQNLANAIANKLLHAPSASIRDAAAENDQTTLWAAAKLFDLDTPATPSPIEHQPEAEE